MRCRQTPDARNNSLPRLWLITDERIGEDTLIRAVARLPKGAGIVFRHYSLPLADRRNLFNRIRVVARRRRLTMLLAGPETLARQWKADGFHQRTDHRCRSRQLHSAPVHNISEIRQAERAGVDLLFLSPLFPTRSHPGARALERIGFAVLARQAKRPVIALGGMTKTRTRSLRALNAYGWAAIDGLTGV